MPKRVLIVDDEEIFLNAIRKVLSLPERVVDTAATLEEAEELLKSSPYHVVVADLRLTGATGFEGLELMKHVRAEYDGVKFILMTGSGNSEIKSEAYEYGVDFFFEKPVSPKKLDETLQHLGV